MKIQFDNQSVLHIMPENSTEAMALRYWEKEYEQHGGAMIEVQTKIPGAALEE